VDVAAYSGKVFKYSFPAARKDILRQNSQVEMARL